MSGFAPLVSRAQEKYRALTVAELTHQVCHDYDDDDDDEDDDNDDDWQSWQKLIPKLTTGVWREEYDGCLRPKAWKVPCNPWDGIKDEKFTNYGRIDSDENPLCYHN